MTTTITLRDAGDLVAVLPYQLGYHPTRSLVVVALHGRRMGLVARVDLPPADTPDTAVEDVADAVVGPLLRQRAATVLVVAFESAVGEADRLTAAVVQRLEAGRVRVQDVSVVRDGRRYSPACVDGCCPPEGAPLPRPAEVPAVAEFVALGRFPLPDRASVDGLLDPLPEAAEVGRHLDGLPAPTRSRRRAAARAWAAVLHDPHPARTHDPAPPAQAVATAVHGLADIALRDAVVAWLAPGVLPPSCLEPTLVHLLERTLPRWGGMGRWRGPARPTEHRDRLLVRLLVLARSVPDSAAAPAAAACTVLAHVAWHHGDGALARAALDRALRLVPDYRLAQLLEDLVDAGVRLDRLTGARTTPDREDAAG